MGQETPEIVRIGQIRRDKRGGTLEVVAPTPARRFLCRYPQLDGEATVLSAETIAECYPFVVTQPPGVSDAPPK